MTTSVAPDKAASQIRESGLTVIARDDFTPTDVRTLADKLEEGGSRIVEATWIAVPPQDASSQSESVQTTDFVSAWVYGGRQL